jgi:hypothetical protein
VIELSLSDVVQPGVYYVRQDGSSCPPVYVYDPADDRLKGAVAPGGGEDYSGTVELPGEAWAIECERRDDVHAAEKMVREAEEAARAVPDVYALMQKYRAIIQPSTNTDDIAATFLRAEAPQARRVGWGVDGVIAMRPNGTPTSLVVLGDDKATKSTELEEDAVTFSTGSNHYGLAPFRNNFNPLRVLMIQEENEHETVMQDLEDIAHARGVELPTDPAQLRVISKPNLNMLHTPTRALLCHTAALYDVLILDSLDRMGVPETNASGELAETLRFLTQLEQQLNTAVVFAWPFAARMRFDFDSSLGGDIIPRWWQGGMALNWNDHTKTRRMKVCALRSRLGRLDYRLVGQGMGRWELEASAKDGEALIPRASIESGAARARAVELRGEGKSVVEIAAILGKTERTIYRYLGKDTPEPTGDGAHDLS